ncbi:type II toxin-antitoxin system RelE/ParE family toxin [Pseudanabaena biceps]|nr:type II toxin-antitoxin system RelE/ParE family toxin [Pseudanabaena biceps]
MPYEIGFKPDALKELRKLDETARKAIISEIELLADNPRPDGCKKLKGEVNLYRIRVFSNYRVVYEIQDRILVVTVVKVAHRRAVYR